MQDIALGLYAATMLVATIIYVYIMLEIRRTDGNFNLFSIFSFKRKIKEQEYNIPTQSKSQPEQKLILKTNNKSAIQIEIDTLSNLLLDIDNSVERRKIANRIKELQSQL